MEGRKKNRYTLAFRAAALAAVVVLVGGAIVIGSGKMSRVSDLGMYDYRDTRRLVALTGRAAALIGKKGEAAFADFRKNPPAWSVDGSAYLYVYDLDGVNLFGIYYRRSSQS